jgi:cytochrome c553
MAHLYWSLAVVATLAACSSPERSRELGNPAVSATTLAQQVCSTCHGIRGQSVSPNFPNLAAQSEAYLVAQLQGFKSHDRSDPAGFEYMWGMSRGLSEAQILGLAAYYAAQAATVQAAESVGGRVAEGQRIFDAGLPDKDVPACASCHGDKGQGMGAFPRIAGQHADYLIKQLVVFQRTDERPLGSIMKTVAHGLGGQDIADVAAYSQRLAP